MRTPNLPLVLLFLAPGCCRKDGPPQWLDPGPITLDAGSNYFDLRDWVTDDSGDLHFTATSDGEVAAGVDAWTLELAPQPGFEGESTVSLTAGDTCGNVSALDLDLLVGAGGDTGDDTTVADACPVALTYTAQGAPDGVAVAGTWNDWDSTDSTLTSAGGGVWSGTLTLAPGAWPYKFVEITHGLYGDDASWTCDPSAPLIQCDAGYKTPDDTSWAQSCTLGGDGCNSLLVVPDCGRPTLALTALHIDRAADSVTASVSYTAPSTGAAVGTTSATLDGAAIASAWTGSGFSVALTGLSEGRHTLRFDATDADGQAAVQIYVPFWLDDFSWDSAVLYYAFVDRLVDGDTSNDGAEGATATLGDYMGGDWQGLIDLLPYLADLGVTALWITNPQDDAAGAWDGQCDATYSSYHGYWPIDPTATEAHFGDAATLKELVDDAHKAGMRVVVDWVGNHVHQDHTYYLNHPDWFGTYAWCEDGDNWNTIPETCWFAPYLPDVDYTNPEPLQKMVNDALDLAKTWEFDGMRVDAAKHMPHSVVWNLHSRISEEIEHTGVGGDEEFWTVGETFDSYDRIGSYINAHELDGQFDFPLYYAIRSTFLDGSTTLPDLIGTAEYSQTVFSAGLMGNFLGNHDVARFVTEGTEDDVDACNTEGVGVRTAGAPWDTGVYARLRLAWTFLLTWPGVPLIYYGDELGIPGYGDPDNRQPLWWTTGDLSDGAVSTVDALAARISGDQAQIVEQVAALARARAAHPALYTGSTVEWWREDDLYAYARTADGDAALIILNRSSSDRTLSNGLSFAGLPSGTYEDAITGDTFTASGDTLTVDVPAMGSRALILR